MFSRILSSAIAAMAIVAAAPAFAADPFDGPGWEPATVDDTTAAPAANACADQAAEQNRAPGARQETSATPVPDTAIACADEQNKARGAREETEPKGAYDPHDRSQDFGG